MLKELGSSVISTFEVSTGEFDKFREFCLSVGAKLKLTVSVLPEKCHPIDGQETVNITVRAKGHAPALTRFQMELFVLESSFETFDKTLAHTILAPEDVAWLALYGVHNLGELTLLSLEALRSLPGYTETRLLHLLLLALHEGISIGELDEEQMIEQAEWMVSHPVTPRTTLLELRFDEKVREKFRKSRRPGRERGN